jgi:hypothetical protein
MKINLILTKQKIFHLFIKDFTKMYKIKLKQNLPLSLMFQNINKSLIKKSKLPQSIYKVTTKL